MPTDRFDLPITTVSPRALELYDDTIERLFVLQPGGDALIDEALSLDPDFALAHCAKARTYMVAGDAPAGRAAARHARDLAERLPPRERGHARIVSMVLNGEPLAASLQAVREHAAAYPRDAVPLSFALGVYGLLGFGGFPDFVDRQVALLENVATAWGDDWWYLAAMGWAQVEAGRADVGIPMLDRALELTPDNANAVHGRAHGYYEQGAAAEGEAFIGNWLPRYDRSAPLHGHLGWHLALFALQRGDTERAVAMYLANVSPNASQALPMFTMIDSAAFAIRCELSGHPLPPEELRAVAAFAERHFPKPGVPFVNVHRALTHAVAHRDSALTAWNTAVDEVLGRGGQASGPVVGDVCHAVSAFTEGRFADAAESLEGLLMDLPRLGGSGAQRDVFIDLAISAHRRAGDAAAAEALAQQRWRHRAGHLDERWLAGLPFGPRAPPSEDGLGRIPPPSVE